MTTVRGGTSAGDHGRSGDERLLAHLHARKQNGAPSDATGASQRRAAKIVTGASHRLIVGRHRRTGR